MNNTFDISNFNIIQDEENYYFFRALNMGDNSDIENGITSENGRIVRVRTDRARWEEDEEKPDSKYKVEDDLTLEQMYDHIKMRQRKDTNCISLSSNANVSISYGRAFYKDKYVLVKVPKSEYRKTVHNAGEYFISEIEKRVEEQIKKLPEDSELLEKIKRIDTSTSIDEIVDSVFEKYKLGSEEKVYTSVNGRKISRSNIQGRFSSYQTLSEKQNLEKNKLFAKLTILEYFAGMEKIIPHTAANTNFLATVGNAISSLELINYGDIEEKSITEVPSKIMDMFALLQQAREKIKETEKDVEKIERNQKLILEIENRLIGYAEKGYDLKVEGESLVFTNGAEVINLGSSVGKYLVYTSENYTQPTIEELYNLTNGEVEYANIKNLLNKNYYGSRAKLRANEFAEIINILMEENPEYEDIIKNIKEECFEVEPAIITRKNRGGYKLSESVSVEFEKSELSLIETIKKLSNEELQNNLEINTKESVQRCIEHIKDRKKVDKNLYYANAIISLYDFKKIGITFTNSQKELFIQKLKEYDLPKIYEEVKNTGITESDVSKVILNFCINNKFKEFAKAQEIKTIVKNNIEELQENLYIEQIEDFLGFYAIEETKIKLKEYQQRAIERLDEIYEDKKFASVILPTGAGKSFVAMAEMLKERYHLRDKENSSKMLYIAPSNEILNQIKKHLVENVIGTKESLGKDYAQIVKEAFPNLELCTYTSLKYRSKKSLENNKYDLIILDELHRTGAKEWRESLRKLLKAQNPNVRILGMTATPERDVDGKNMVDRVAQKLGYSDEEIKDGKHRAINMDLMYAIRNEIVVNPKVVSCEYNLQENERFINLLKEINQIEDEKVRKEKLAKYEELRRSIQNADGVTKILGDNLKQGGKYIVFVPISEEEEIEDEFGNKISNKLSAEEKIKKAEEQLKEWLKETGKEAKFYSMLGSYSDRQNAKNLESFEKENGQEIKFMLAINKLNEGVHLDGVDGIVWMRALDRNSKILLLQQMGRCIYALDENNKISEDKLPVIIDLPNNLMTVDMQKEINNYTETDDLEMLQDIVEWIKFHNDHLPDIESKGKEEQRKAVTLKRIQKKYIKYLEGNLENLDEEELEKIQKILEIGEEIDLWNIELPDKKDKDGKVIPIDELVNIDVFKLDGKIGRLCELEDDVEKINSLKRARKLINELEEWCVEEFGDEENPKCKRYERHMPRNLENVRAAKEGEEETKEQREKRLAGAISKSSLIKAYKTGEEIPEESKELIERYKRLEETYKISNNEALILELEEWCVEEFGDEENPKCKRYERHMPRNLENVRAAKEGEEETKEQREKRLARAISDSSLIKAYKTGEEIPEESKELIERYKRLEEIYTGNMLVVNFKKIVMELEEWCVEEFGDEENPKCKRYERHMPRRIANVRVAKEGEEETKEQREKRLANAIGKSSLIKAYKTGEEIPEESKELIERYKRLEETYKISNNEALILELEEWCVEEFGDEENSKCKRYERHMPRNLENVRAAKEGEEETKEQREKRLANAIGKSSLIKAYKTGEEIPEESKELIERYKRLEETYKISNNEALILELEEWCVEEFGDEENSKCKRYERHMPRNLANVRAAKEQRENRLANAIRNSSLIKAYNAGEEIPEESKELIERYKRLEEIYTGNMLVVNFKKIVMELEEWCVEEFGDEENPKCKRYERHMPRRIANVRATKEGEEETKEQRENRLALAIRRSSLIKAYNAGEEIPEESKELIERYKRLEEMYISDEQRKRVSKKVPAQKLGQAIFDAPTEKCIEAENVVNDLMKEQSKSKDVEVNN